eukprot:852332-Prymnesium_polylepis.1
MKITETTHPPAGAYAFLFVAQKMSVKNVLYPGFAGCCILVAVQQMMLFISAQLKPSDGDKKKQ